MNSLQFSHSPPDGRRTISLSLQDLRTDGENINTSNRQQTVTSSKDLMDSYSSLNESLTEISQQESYYRENFYLLLQKSHGTKYEHALRRLYESDLENDSNLATYVQEQSHAQTTQSNDSVALSRSRSFAEQSRIDSNLAKPLERRIWKVRSKYRGCCSHCVWYQGFAFETCSHDKRKRKAKATSKKRL